MFCGKCGRELEDDCTFCPMCGAKVNNEIVEETSKKDVIQNNITENNNTSATVTKNIVRKNGDNKKEIIVLAIIIIIVILLVVSLIIIFMNLSKQSTSNNETDATVQSAENIEPNQENILITYDDGSITQDRFLVYYKMFYDYLKSYGYTDEEIVDEIVLKTIADDMILNEAIKNNIELSKEEIDEIENTFKDEEYIDYIKNELEINVDDFKEVYYNDYKIQSYLEVLSEEATDDEIEEYIKSKYTDSESIDMTEYETSHILITDFDTAQDVLERAKNGEDFANLAREYSEDTPTANLGGKYYVYDDGNTVDEYANTVFSMNVGEIYNELVSTYYGYHIIKLDAKNENARVNNKNERLEYVRDLFDNSVKNSNYKINEEKMENLLNSIS